ncbi:ceramide transfer protein isoform X1 [Periplaneta americana]|uniref:ceramide transfer protein isoform X1 n=1 Tax=Periplaneta americana TaxID=6978 RepID=UPI0037E8A43A
MTAVVSREIMDEHGLIFSDEDDDSENGYQVPEIQGVLSKWTNYIHGWQSRFIVLKDGTLSYYKSEQDTGFGCRGAISLFKATIKPHEFDECRFDVSVNDCVWYLRAETPEEKQRWVETLDAYKTESGYGSENNLKRHGSAISLTSNTLSTASTSSFKKGRGLKEKLAEMETFRDILCRQIETLQGYFDACAEASTSLKHGTGLQDEHSGTTSNAGELKDKVMPPCCENASCVNCMVGSDTAAQHGAHAIDFKGEAMTFKATTAGVLATLQHCLELLGQREETWRRRLEREAERRRKTEELYRAARQEAASHRLVVHGSPDYEEGPHSALNDEEFYDAVETGLDKMDEEMELRDRLKTKQQQLSVIGTSKTISKATQHRLWPEIDRISVEQLRYARLGVGEGGWQLFAEDGEMKMYKREEESNGMVVDPLKACHVVRGVTGHEMCHYFFSPDVRMEWETTVEQMTVIEKIADDTLVFLQVHKRIWPASQRDALFWSHMRQVPDHNDRDGHDIWIVCNHSTDNSDFPSNNGKCVRVTLTVCLVCQTFIDPPKDGAKITRDDITCKITYCSVVNPGGWAPASVLRAVYKREYPKFLKRFTAYVIDQCKDKPIMF